MESTVWCECLVGCAGNIVEHGCRSFCYGKYKNSKKEVYYKILFYYYGNHDSVKLQKYLCASINMWLNLHVNNMVN